MENINVAFDGERKRIGGWLVFFLVILLFDGVTCLVTNILSHAPNLTWIGLLFGLSGSLVSISKFLLSIYVVYTFFKRGRNAVFLGKLYALAHALYFGWYLLDHLFTRTALPFKGVYIVTFAFYLILWLYLRYSKRIEELYPKAWRKRLKRDFVIVAACIILPFIVPVVLTVVIASRSAEPPQVCSNELMQFTVPNGYDEYHVADSGWFCLSPKGNKAITTVLIGSDTNTMSPQIKFQEGWTALQEDFNGMEGNVIVDEVVVIEGKTCYLKTIQYDAVLVSEYAMLFNEDFTKIGTISCLLRYGEKSPMNDLLNSFEFK